jgi:hypothetical protein
MTEENEYFMSLSTELPGNEEMNNKRLSSFEYT